MSGLRLTVKIYLRDEPARPLWRWHDAIAVPRVGDFVAPPGAAPVCVVLAVTWVEANEVNVIVRAQS